MNQVFLENLLHVAQTVTQADRGLIVDHDTQVVVKENLTQADVDASEFQSFAISNLKKAIGTGEAVIANTVITDLSEAPTTNTNFADLRIAVALPVKGHGAIYLDRHIRDGVIPKRIIDRLEQLVSHVLQNSLEDKSKEDLLALYEQITPANS